MDIRQQAREAQARNRAAIQRSNRAIEKQVTKFVFPEPPRSRKNHYLLTFFHVAPGGRRLFRFANDAMGYAAMMEYLDTLPLAGQLRAAGIEYALSLKRKSSLALKLSQDDYVMLKLMIPRDTELVRFDETAMYRKGIAVKLLDD